MNIRKSIALISASVYAIGLYAKPYAPEDLSWDNPEFVQWFTGTYAFNGQINPQINSDEQALFQSISGMMGTQPAEAIREIQTYISSLEDPEKYSPALDYTIGSLYLQDNDITSGIRLYRKAIDRFPTFQRAFQNLGLALVQAGRYEDAVPYLTKAIELGGTGGTVWGLLGYAYLNLGKPSLSLTAYEQALVFQPESRDWILGKLNSLLDAGENTKAIALLDEMIRDDPKETQLWLQQANAFLGTGRMLEAAANLERVARQGEGSGASFILLGDIYLNEALPALALDAYLAALAEQSVPSGKFIRILASLFQRGATAEAMSFVREMEDSFLNNLTEEEELEMLNLKSRIAMAEGDLDGAANILEQIIDRDPVNGNALLGLGDYYRDQGEWQKAILKYEHAASVEEVQVAALHALARIYVTRQNYVEALRRLEEAQRIDPKGYVADYIRQIRNIL